MPVNDAPSLETWWVQKCKEYRQSVVRLECGGSIGTGWIAACREDAFLLATARHVIDHPACSHELRIYSEGAAEAITLSLGDMEVAYADAELDVAAIPVFHAPPGPSLRMLVRGEPSKPASLFVAIPPLGIEVGWIGFAETPSRVFGKPTMTFCRGYISAVGNERKGNKLFCLDGNVNRGMSGGPVWDTCGNIMGMVIAYSVPSCTRIGLNNSRESRGRDTAW